MDGGGHLTKLGATYMPHSFRSLVEVLRSILRRLEETPELDHRDPKYVGFRECILDSIALLEVRRPHAA